MFNEKLCLINNLKDPDNELIPESPKILPLQQYLTAFSYYGANADLHLYILWSA